MCVTVHVGVCLRVYMHACMHVCVWCTVCVTVNCVFCMCVYVCVTVLIDCVVCVCVCVVLQREIHWDDKGPGEETNGSCGEALQTATRLPTGNDEGWQCGEMKEKGERERERGDYSCMRGEVTNSNLWCVCVCVLHLFVCLFL